MRMLHSRSQNFVASESWVECLHHTAEWRTVRRGIEFLAAGRITALRTVHQTVREPCLWQNRGPCAPFCRPIETSGAPARPLYSGLQVALALESMQQRIQRAGTDAVAVASQLAHHSLPIEFSFHGVVQDVQADQAGQRLMKKPNGQ
jgi:hypothetical protein